MPTPTPERWHTHGWNRELSWRLLLGILPKIPVALRPPLHALFTSAFFVVMGNERRSAARNLEQVTGARGVARLLLTWKLFYNFSRYLAAYTELPPHGDGTFQGRISGGIEPLTRMLAQGRGAIVIGMHLGQWELALSLLSRSGYPVTMLMRREDEAASRFARKAREASGIRVVYAGESPWTFVELLAALRRNEVVAMQGDRDMGGRSLDVPLCGKRVRIPAGPWELAAASGAGLLAGVLVFEGHRAYRSVWAEAVTVAPRRERGDGETDPAVLGRVMESLIRRYPDQWFNFYDVWPREDDAHARP
jgi:KDO2-lipid IV(A) lauroyltransferase